MTKFDVELKKVLKQVYNQYESKFKGEIGQTAFIQQFVPEREKEEQAKTGFIYWSMDNRDAVTKMIEEKNKTLPDDQKLTPKDTMRELGRRWREDISTKEKDKYNKKASDEKKKLDAIKEKKSNNDNHNEAKVAAEQEINSKNKDKPVNGYQAFINNNREEIKKKNPTWKPKEINKYLTGEWNKKSKVEKAEYTAEIASIS
tara:strand:+ start:215 stop:817 length:603 start_codon:yes stop_codon:yes gene_type:complete